MPSETVEKPAKAKSRSTGGRSRAVTLADVAAQAGVSSVAVSVVLNNTESRVKVSEATRERILDAAKSLGYQPNALARSLRLQRTNIIGFYNTRGYTLDPRYPFFGALMAGLIEGCEAHRKDFLLHGTFQGRSDDDVYQELRNGKIDGLVLYVRKSTPLVQRIIDSGMTVVTVVNEVEGLPCVSVDDTSGGTMMAQYLGEQGHKSVLYLGAPEEPPTLLRRYQSFEAECQRQGIDLTTVGNNGYAPSQTVIEYLSGSRGPRPDAVACYNDSTADGLIEYCTQSGIRVPEDVAIVGFDGLGPGNRPARSLTTIAADWAAVAHSAVSLLVAQCDGETVPLRTVLPVTFRKGDTA